MQGLSYGHTPCKTWRLLDSQTGNLGIAFLCPPLIFQKEAAEENIQELWLVKLEISYIRFNVNNMDIQYLVVGCWKGENKMLTNKDLEPRQYKYTPVFYRPDRQKGKTHMLGCS